MFEHITDTTLTRRREREQGVMSLFGDWGGEADDRRRRAGFDERLPIPDVEFDKSDKLRNEKEMLGLYVSDHPLFGSRRRCAARSSSRSPTSPSWATARPCTSAA